MSTRPVAARPYPFTVVGEAAAPPEARGLARDEVRMAVARPDGIDHTRAGHLPEHLHAGDLLVVNTSATLPSALVARSAAGDRVGLHVSTRLDDGAWVVEPRRPDNTGPHPATAGDRLELPGGVHLRLAGPHPPTQRRLWRAVPSPPTDRVSYLQRYGAPIRYRYVNGEWPIESLQNVYATEPGSAEMPSAGRPLSERLLVRLMAAGVTVAPVVLHTGVASQEKHEPPQPEPYTVPAATARMVNHARAVGRRVVAVGTTSVRALESATSRDRVVPTAGWTELVLGPQRPARVVNGLLTGLHEPEASHLALLEAVAGRPLVDRAYAAVTSVEVGEYLWHEFGDTMLLLP